MTTASFSLHLRGFLCIFGLVTLGEVSSILTHATALIVTALDMKLRPLFMLTCSVADLRGERLRRPFTGHRCEINQTLTFPPSPGQELDTEGTYLSPPGVFSLWRQN